MRIMRHFNVFEPDSHIMVWGCSATLVRMDMVALGNLFEAITFSLDMHYMIQQKWYSLNAEATLSTRFSNLSLLT